MTSSWSSETMRISREHFGHLSGSASHTFWVNLAPFLARDAARLVGGNVDHLHGVALGRHFFVRLLGRRPRILLEYRP